MPKESKQARGTDVLKKDASKKSSWQEKLAEKIFDSSFVVAAFLGFIGGIFLSFSEILPISMHYSSKIMEQPSSTTIQASTELQACLASCCCACTTEVKACPATDKLAEMFQ